MFRRITYYNAFIIGSICFLSERMPFKANYKAGASSFKTEISTISPAKTLPRFLPSNNFQFYQRNKLQFHLQKLEGFINCINTNNPVSLSIINGYSFFIEDFKTWSGNFTKKIKNWLSLSINWWKSGWFNHILAVTIILAGYGLMRFYIKRKLNRQRILLEKQKAIELERLRISSDLHDDLGGGLSTIRLLSEMLRNGEGHGHEQEHLLKISENSKELVQKLNEIVWALNVKNDNLESLLFYIRKYTVQFLDTLEYTVDVNMPDNIPSLEVSGEKRREIFLLVKEILNNIVKHSAANTVAMHIKVDNFVTITIHDNGKGINTDGSTKVKGNGLLNMQRRIDLLNGKLSINTNQGTIIIFSIPIGSLYNQSGIAT